MAVGTITRVSADPHGIPNPIVFGDTKMTVTTVVGSASYTTGGDALTPANLGLSFVTTAIVSISASSGSNCSAVEGNYLTSGGGLLQCFSAADAAGCPVSETASTTNLSGLTFTVWAFGY